jgi:carbon-monoxide dehydrogenase medium subunit
MIPGKFSYFAPTTLNEAVSLLSQQKGAKILAGGQSLIPAMKLRLAGPEVLIDINRVAGMDYIKEEGGFLVIGAMTREASLDESALVHQKYPLLADTAAVIADPLVRNMATVGGNLAHADPANDHPATMLAFGAQVVAVGPKGERTISIDDFFVGLFENSLAKDEILREIRVPAPQSGSGGAYIKMERKVGDYAVGGVAVYLTMSGNTCQSARIGLTNVAATPMRAKNAEAALTGKALDDAAIKAAGTAAGAECDPSSDLRGTADYKRDIIRVLTMRAIRKAAERARGG